MAAQAGFPAEANAMLDLIGRLYALEAGVPKGAEYNAQRWAVRQSESRKVLSEIEA